jgi:hypothetical protein
MKRRIAAALSTLLWAFFTYIGYDGILGVIRQHAPGYPNAGQWHYYVHFPSAMLFLSVGLLLFARKMHIGLFIALRPATRLVCPVLPGVHGRCVAVSSVSFGQYR